MSNANQMVLKLLDESKITIGDAELLLKAVNSSLVKKVQKNPVNKGKTNSLIGIVDDRKYNKLANDIYGGLPIDRFIGEYNINTLNPFLNTI